jgi:hypothetical protein
VSAVKPLSGIFLLTTYLLFGILQYYRRPSAGDFILNITERIDFAIHLKKGVMQAKNSPISER